MTEESATREATADQAQPSLQEIEIKEAMERLSKARAGLAELEQRREARERAAALQEQARAKELALKDELTIEELEQQHPGRGRKWDVIYTGQGVVAVKKPHHVTFNKFQDAQKYTTDSLRKFVTPCVLHPKLGEFEHMLEEEPAILVRAANKCSELAGVGREDLAGK
jgi:hypothetical protein